MGWLRVSLSLASFVVACGVAFLTPAGAQENSAASPIAGSPEALSAEINRLFKAGNFADAVPLAQRLLAIREKALGSEHLQVGNSLNDIALLYKSQGSYDEAEPLYKRSLVIREKALGPDHPLIGASLNNLAALYRAQGRIAEAEPLYTRSLAIREKALGPEHPDVGQSLNNLAGLYTEQGRYAEAEPLYKRSLAIRERALGAEHPDVGMSLNNLAYWYDAQGRYSEAEPLFKRSLVISEKALGPDHPDVSTSLNNLAELYKSQGRTDEAEPLYKRALAITEKALGPDHRDVGTRLNNLAGLYRDQDRYGEAEPLYKRSLTIFEKVLGADHPDVATLLNNLAELYKSQGRTAQAEPLYKRALAIDEKALGAGHSRVGIDLNNLAALYQAQGLTAKAEPLYKRSLAIYEETLGPEHPDVSIDLNNLAALYRAQGRTAEAEPLYKRSLAIREKALGPDHLDVSMSLNNLAFLALAQRDWTSAAGYWLRSTAIIQRRAERGLGGGSGGSSNGEAQQKSWYFSGLVKATYLLATERDGERARHAAEMFETAQWGRGSEAAASLAQMAARSAKGSPELAALVRERQDLVVEWQGSDKRLIATKSLPPARRNAASEKVLSDRLAMIDARLAVIDVRLAKDFPDYAALASSKPISTADVQANLRDDEALVLFLDTDARFKPLPEETFVWVVTKTDVRWVRSQLGTAALGNAVAGLRCGLDYEASWGSPSSKQQERCTNLLKVNYTPSDYDRGSPLPFSIGMARELYEALFGQVEDLIKDKSLLIVPSGALTQLPFQVLVTALPDPVETGSDAMRKARWLIRDHAITVLPSVSSLKALRENTKASQATKALVGFGNPLLDGGPADVEQARKARLNTTCPVQVASISGLQRGVSQVATRGPAEIAAQLKELQPLPETADELCAVAFDLHVGSADVHLGGRATVAAVEKLSETGELANYHFVHFATHGALSGAITGKAEPGLVLTPPAQPSAEDDGYLSASRIASLKLDADWVILSACNTAAGGANGAEALSGLARAFFYAGARALLVSHWSVDSEATVKLITEALGRMAADKHLGRAEAMRQSMLALIDTGQAREADPSYWAPFIVVGEGAAAK